jgi:hypothetical protein
VTLQEIFVCVDPCGGGASALAVVTVVWMQDSTVVVVGADALAVANDEEQERFLHQHLSRVRDVPALCNGHIILVVERNFGGAVLASRIANICAPFQPLSAMTQDTNKSLRRCGVVTTGPVKERMRVELQRLLRSNAVRFSEPFVSMRTDTVDSLCTQLREYHFEVRESDEKTNRGPKIWLTGKARQERACTS